MFLVVLACSGIIVRTTAAAAAWTTKGGKIIIDVKNTPFCCLVFLVIFFAYSAVTHVFEVSWATVEIPSSRVAACIIQRRRGFIVVIAAVIVILSKGIQVVIDVGISKELGGAGWIWLW